MRNKIKILANDVFIVTKPLQYINVLNIESKHKKVLIFVDLFVNAKIIFDQIENNNSYWHELYFFKNMDVVFNWIVKNKLYFNSIYIDSDINRRYEFFLLRKLNIILYEEGVGTYRRKQYMPRRKIIGNLYLAFLSLLGYKNRRGGSKYTKKIIVYFPAFYKSYIGEFKKDIIKFKLPFIDHIKNLKNIEIFNSKIKLSEFKNKTIAIYLPSWNINNSAIKIINELNCERRIVKLHPHTQNSNINPLQIKDFDLSISPDIPAEILILNLIDVAKKIFIISEFSSSTMYFQSTSNIEIINIPISNKEIHNNTDSYLDAYHNLTAHINLINKK